MDHRELTAAVLAAGGTIAATAGATLRWGVGIGLLVLAGALVAGALLLGYGEPANAAQEAPEAEPIRGEAPEVAHVQLRRMTGSSAERPPRPWGSIEKIEREA